MVKNCIQMEMYRFGEKFKGVDCTGKKYMQTTRRLQILHDRKCGRKKSSESTYQSDVWNRKHSGAFPEYSAQLKHFSFSFRHYVTT